MIGVIADDLTGAAELAAAGYRHGLRAEVWLKEGVRVSSDLICMDSDSRSCPPVVAGRRAANAARALRRRGSGWIYKKTDSAMRGSIAAELTQLMRVLKFRRALLIPANPSRGRIIQNGKYFINGVPIHKTDFRFDPEYPCRSCSVKELLNANTEVYVCSLDHALPERGIIIGEAESPEDLRRWAAKCDGTMLAAGAVEFFVALLQEQGRRPKKDPVYARAPAGVRQLFVCGSASASTRQFLRRSRLEGVPVFTLPRYLMRGGKMRGIDRRRMLEEIAAAYKRNKRVILAVGFPMVKDLKIARRFSVELAALAAQAVEKLRLNELFAEGGATAANLARALGWSQLELCREIAPGVAKMRARVVNRFLTIKPGSYSWSTEAG